MDYEYKIRTDLAIQNKNLNKCRGYKYKEIIVKKFYQNKFNFTNILFNNIELKENKANLKTIVVKEINSLLKKHNIKKEIVTSNKPNTTLDFIKLKFDNYIIYDTPGFDYLNLNYKIVNNEIKPLTFNIKKDTTIIINNAWELFFNEPNSVTIYTTHNSIKRVFKNVLKTSIVNKVFNNCDIVIPGIGFINVKNSCNVLTNLEVLEIRPNISGEEYE